MSRTPLYSACAAVLLCLVFLSILSMYNVGQLDHAAVLYLHVTHNYISHRRGPTIACATTVSSGNLTVKEMT